MRLAPELKSKIDSLWDKFWSGGMSNPLQSIEQMSYLIFMNRLEEMDTFEEKRAKAKGLPYTSIYEGQADCRWSHWKHYSADKMLVHVRDEAFPFIKNIHNGEKTLFARHMKDAVFLIPKPSLLQEAVTIIDEMKISAQNRDTQGDIYEYLLSQLSTAGKNGQFRTPRHIIRMMVELVDPDINDRICDPACGTAGFLVNSYEHILKKYTSSDKVEVDADGEYHNILGDKITNPKHWDKLWKETFYGYDFDNTMVRISLMNMVLHGIKAPLVAQRDTLSKSFTENDQYTVVLANPPFKGSIDKSDINDALTLQTTKTELLFVERMMHLLQIGGKCAVIVPDGVLFGSSNAHKKLRQILLEQCQLEGIVSMPSGIFKPYAGVSTAVIIFTKGGSTGKVWFYDMDADGYSLDDKRTFIDGKGDIPDIIQHYRIRKKENPTDRKGKCFFVPISEIKENGFDLSISRYKEIEYEEVQYEKPEVIIQKIETLEKEIQNGLKDLKSLLKDH
ncbi:MAG: type I restriction-modification system subunit M [Methanoregula sp.]|jgi:type I restriction enzyme M protein|uniref:type I restriction-modification system subunit M n=1 Tax=Methanoregula sp. TaxID=2052170 RepID=UPI0025D409AC|nr:class I SAM-dependent DNA methyltransferase [Methanoregula sp.]MCK9631372.1 type I restriction-modification system subunit M [Methanoregula sp.]